MVKPLLCMLSVVRLPLRALYCNVALQSGVNVVQTDFQGVHKFIKSSNRLTATYMTSGGSHSDNMNNKIDNSLDEPSAVANVIKFKETVGLCDFDCNILHKDLFLDKERYMTSAMEVGIKYFIVPGSSISESQLILTAATAETRIRLIGTAGVHPYSSVKDEHSMGNLALLETLVADRECYAVGECGLDYSPGFPGKQPQIEWFRSHVSLALRHSKPLYLHSREAEEDFLGVLTEFGFGQFLEPAVPCCVHCFTGTTLELQRYLDCGFFIGLTGFIFKMDDAKLLLWLQMITLERLVIETDAPYMGFKGCRSAEISDKKKGYPNVPGSLLKILDRVCSVSGWTAAEVTSKTTANALTGFLRIAPEDY